MGNTVKYKVGGNFLIYLLDVIFFNGFESGTVHHTVVKCMSDP